MSGSTLSVNHFVVRIKTHRYSHGFAAVVVNVLVEVVLNTIKKIEQKGFEQIRMVES